MLRENSSTKEQIMCDSTNRQIVETVVQAFVLARKPFTAWDITQEARKRGATEFHNQMKGVVHAEFVNIQGDNYSRQTISLPGVSPDPWLYHPAEYDPQDYVDEVIAQLGGPAAVVDAQTDDDNGVDTSSVDGDNDVPFDASTCPGNPQAKGQPTTKEGRLTIPNSKWGTGVTIMVFVNPGDEIRLVPDTGCKSSVTPTGFTKTATYRVNADGRIRLGPKVLQAANLRDNRYEIAQGSWGVSVTAAG